MIRVMRTGAGDINPDDELCQSRKQRAASAVGEGSIAFELVHHTWIDFDYHRTNDDSEA